MAPTSTPGTAAESRLAPCVCGETATRRRYSLVPVLPFAVLWMAFLLGVVLIAGKLQGTYQISSVLLWSLPVVGLALVPLAARCRACAQCSTLRTGPFGWNIEAFDQSGLKYCLDRLDASESQLPRRLRELSGDHKSAPSPIRAVKHPAVLAAAVSGAAMILAAHYLALARLVSFAGWVLWMSAAAVVAYGLPIKRPRLGRRNLVVGAVTLLLCAAIAAAVLWH